MLFLRSFHSISDRPCLTRYQFAKIYSFQERRVWQIWEKQKIRHNVLSKLFFQKSNKKKVGGIMHVCG